MRRRPLGWRIATQRYWRSRRRLRNLRGLEALNWKLLDKVEAIHVIHCIRSFLCEWHLWIRVQFWFVFLFSTCLSTFLRNIESFPCSSLFVLLLVGWSASLSCTFSDPFILVYIHIFLFTVYIPYRISPPMSSSVIMLFCFLSSYSHPLFFQILF